MSIFKRGDDAKKELEGKGKSVDLSKVFIRLKSGKSKKVRILSPSDYVTYKAHTHFNKGIMTTPCVKGARDECNLCLAANYDGDLVGDLIDTAKNRAGEEVSSYNQMYAKLRTAFAFVDLDEEDGELKIIDLTDNQSDVLISTIDEYAEDLDDMAFTLKRTGEGRDTAYSLNPIMPKKMKEIQETFDAWENEEVEMEFFEKALQPRSDEDHLKDLKKSGFPIEKALDKTVDSTTEEVEDEDGQESEETSKEKASKEKATKSKPKETPKEDGEMEDDDLPF